MTAGRTLTEGTPWKVILSFTLPVLLGILLQQLYNTADTVIVGNFSSEAALSAVGTTACITMLFLAVANGFSAGAGVLIAQMFGAKQENEMRRASITSMFLLLGMGAVTSIVGVLSSRPILQYALGVEGHILSMSDSYLKIYACGLIFQFGYNIVAAILRGVGDSKASLYFLLIACVVNVLLDILFVAGFHWGPAGAGLATDLAQAGSFLAALVYMRRRYPVFCWGRSEWKFDWTTAKEVLTLGLPMALQQAVASLGFVFIQRAVNSYRQGMMASYTVGQRVEAYLDMPVLAFQMTMATYVGQNVGARKLMRVTEGTRQAVILSLSITACLSALVFFFAGSIIRLFDLGTDAAAYCLQHLRFTAVVKLIVASYFPVIGALQGVNCGLTGTVAVGSALAVRVISTYTLCYVPWIGYHIIWGNQVLGFSTACLIVWSYYLSGRWRRRTPQNGNLAETEVNSK